MSLPNDPAFDIVRANMYRASDLQLMEFPPVVGYIDGLVYEGLTILGGKPKQGKSWMGIRAALTIASGGVAFGNPDRAVTTAPVLYMALEDGPRRLQDRLTTLTAPGENWPADLRMVTSWPRFDQGGVDLLADMLVIDGYKVVFVDTLGRVRGPRKGQDSYGEDSDALSQIHDLARTTPGLAIVLIHHNRKDDRPDDYIDALSGTTGITGVVDHIAVLQRARGEADAVLRFTSRDAAEHDTAYSMNGGAWTELGNAAEHDLSKARRFVLDALDGLNGSGSLTEISEMVDRPKGNTLKLLRGLANDGLVYQDGQRGPWKRSNSDNTDNSEGRELSKLSELSDFRIGDGDASMFDGRR